MKYLKGWYVGYYAENVQGDNFFCNETTESEKDENGHYWPVTKTIIYKTQNSAIKAAKELAKLGVSEVRPMKYTTDNPANAKGLQLLSEVDPKLLKRITFEKVA